MKKIVNGWIFGWLFFLVAVSGIPQIVAADENTVKMEAGIQFVESTDESSGTNHSGEEQNGNGSSGEQERDSSVINKGKLPQTGETISSEVYVVIGSVLVIFVCSQKIKRKVEGKEK